MTKLLKQPPYLVQAKILWITDMQFNNVGSGIDEPAPVVLASRHHHYLTQIIIRQAPGIQKTDSPTMRKIKIFCQQKGIVDIKTRMLKVPELKRIQGFGDDYYPAGNQSVKKKFIGNSVPHDVVKAMMEALATKLINIENLAA